MAEWNHNHLRFRTLWQTRHLSNYFSLYYISIKKEERLTYWTFELMREMSLPPHITLFICVSRRYGNLTRSGGERNSVWCLDASQLACQKMFIGYKPPPAPPREGSRLLRSCEMGKIPKSPDNGSAGEPLKANDRRKKVRRVLKVRRDQGIIRANWGIGLSQFGRWLEPIEEMARVEVFRGGWISVPNTVN